MQEIKGTLFVRGDSAVILADQDKLDIFLKFALIEAASGSHLLPESLVDDWGKEITGLELYTWIIENGQYFPRAEVFGLGTDGQPMQRFLRELEINTSYPCYVYSKPDNAVETGKLLAGIILPDRTLEEARASCKPAWAVGLLGNADVQWWCANPEKAEHRDQILNLLLN